MRLIRKGGNMEKIELLTVELKCPFCKVTFDFSSGDFEDDVQCSKCGAFAEAWFFPHRLKGMNVWSIGDHYPNEVLCYSKSKFLQYFNDFNVSENQFGKIRELYLEYIKKKRFPNNEFMERYVRGNFPEQL